MNQAVTLYQLELNQEVVNCGMSYVIRLKSGRFLLIDGGYFTDGEAERLYEFLRSLSPGEIHIEGWFFSHPHQDHIGAFINFVERNHARVRIDTLYFNNRLMELPAEEVDYRSSDPATVKEFYRIVDRFFLPEQIHILKTGEILSFEEVRFEVLYTHEDLGSEESTVNDYSSVLMMEAGGQKILWLGDLYRKGSAWLLAHKREKLACDMVQIAHHGYDGATKELYAALNAKIALWPTPDYQIGAIARSEVNQYLLHASAIQEHLFSGQGTAVLPLPYAAGTARRLPKEFFQYCSIIN